jgi:hypothetical protein
MAPDTRERSNGTRHQGKLTQNAHSLPLGSLGFGDGSTTLLLGEGVVAIVALSGGGTHSLSRTGDLGSILLVTL